MEIRFTLKNYNGINGLGPQPIATLGYYQNPADNTYNTSKAINEFSSECFCIYTQSMKIENGDWQIVDGN